MYANDPRPDRPVRQERDDRGSGGREPRRGGRKTPQFNMNLRNQRPMRTLSLWVMIILVWVLAIAGIIVKLLFFETLSKWVGLGMYLGLGWIGVISGFSVWRKYDTHLLMPLLLGGLAYTLGAILDVVRFRWTEIIPGVIGPHELLHFAVLAGMGFHWWFLYRALEYEPL